ncbi:MAG TPA: hypothetical protein VF989_09935, partial [Polyangiaceae bacterium]
TPPLPVVVLAPPVPVVDAATPPEPVVVDAVAEPPVPVDDTALELDPAEPLVVPPEPVVPPAPLAVPVPPVPSSPPHADNTAASAHALADFSVRSRSYSIAKSPVKAVDNPGVLRGATPGDSLGSERTHR